MIHAFVNGLTNNKYSDKDVKKIRMLNKEGIGIKKLSKMFGISGAYCVQIIKGNVRVFQK